ncbi:hypothetical protein LINGRAHAP2_LOCUS4914 [Linum grandiflorum]
MEGNRKLMEENRQVVEGRLDGFGQNHQQVTPQLKSLYERYESYNCRVDRRVGMGELPPRGRNSGPTFIIPVDQPHMHGMARPYVAPASIGGEVGLSGGDPIPHMLIRDLCHTSSMVKAWTPWGSRHQGATRGAWA